MTQSGHGPVFPCAVGKLASSEFEKWSILNRLGCQTGSALASGAFHPPRNVERPSQPLLVGCYECVCVLSPARNVGLFFWSLSCVVVLRKQLAETPNFRPFASRHPLPNKVLGETAVPNQTMIIRRSSRQQAARIACLVPMNTVAQVSGRCHVSHGRFYLYGHQATPFPECSLRCANRRPRCPRPNLRFSLHAA